MIFFRQIYYNTWQKQGPTKIWKLTKNDKKMEKKKQRTDRKKTGNSNQDGIFI